jgi:hypothetical protein
MERARETKRQRKAGTTQQERQQKAGTTRKEAAGREDNF